MRLLNSIGAIFTFVIFAGTGSVAAHASDVTVQEARDAMNTVLTGFDTSDPALLTRLSASTVLINGVLTEDTPEAFG